MRERSPSGTKRRRFADMVVDVAGNRLIAVRENHAGQGPEPANEIVGVDLENGEETVLLSGNDFYSSPRLSPDGDRLAWLACDHPNMPWDGTDLLVCDLDAEGLPENAERVAGGLDESIFPFEGEQHGFRRAENIRRALDGELYFYSRVFGFDLAESRSSPVPIENL